MSKIDLTSIISDFAKEYDWHIQSQNPKPKTVGDGINSGLCDVFAENVKAHYPEAKIIYDEDIDHYYLRIGNLFFDAENPKGVSNQKNMIFGNQCLHKENTSEAKTE